MSEQPKKPRPINRKGGRKPPPDGLSTQQQRFVAEYVANGGHAGKAALAAGYSPATASKQGPRLTRTPLVREAIKAQQAKVVKKLEIKAEDVLGELAKVAFDVELSPLKVRALELLGKHLQLFVERVDLKVDALTPEERAARAAALIATARNRLLGGGLDDDEGGL